MTDKIEEKKENGLGWKMWTGIVASFLYAIAAICILVMNLSYSPPSPPLGLNEIGDYLAGVFSPLAFLWLVIGYLMQNKELKNQINEFQSNTELQKKIYRDKYRALQPNLKIEQTKEYEESIGYDAYGQPIGTGVFLFSIEIMNTGEEIYSLFLFEKRENMEQRIISEEINSVKKNIPIILKTRMGKDRKGKKSKMTFRNPLTNETSEKYSLRDGNFYFSFQDKERRTLYQKVDFWLIETTSDSGKVSYKLNGSLFREITSNDY